MPEKKIKKILVVDDEAEICQLLENRLHQEGYEVFTANDGNAAIDKTRSLKPDLLILDIMMPGRDGIDVCKELKTDPITKKIPIIMLTARGTSADEVLGLEIGADDYVVKPYEYRVLSTRIKKLLAKADEISTAHGGEKPSEVLKLGPIELDPIQQRVNVEGEEIRLTGLEFRILQCFLGRPGQVFSRKELVKETWKGEANLEGRAVDVHITSLRKKLKSHGNLVETVYGSGYRISARP